MFNGDNKLFVEIYKSEYFGQGKSFMIQQRAFKFNQYDDDKHKNLIRIPFNDRNIDLDFVVNRLYECYRDRIKRNKIIYHIDISSSASDRINCLLFNLLFLKHVSSPKNKCFSINNDMIFLIELPSGLSDIKNGDEHKMNINEIENEFYLLHKPMAFNMQIVNNENNPFEYSDDCRYAANFLQYFYSNKLKTEDPDPNKLEQKEKLSEKDIDKILNDHFSKPDILNLSKVHQKSFWQYLYTQFRQIVSSHLLQTNFKIQLKTMFSKTILLNGNI